MKDHPFCKTGSAGHKCVYALYTVPPRQRSPLLKEHLSYVPKGGLSKGIPLYVKLFMCSMYSCGL